jgi:hypothetical protein
MNSKTYNELAELTTDELDRVSGGSSDTKRTLVDAVVGVVVGMAAAVPLVGNAVVVGVGAANMADAADTAKKK